MQKAVSRQPHTVGVLHDDLAGLSLRQALAGLRTHQFNAQRYAHALLDRSEALNHLHAFSWMDPDRVLAQARAADAADPARHPLAGLPLIVKDNIDTPGFVTSAGNAWLARTPPPARAAAVWEACAKLGAVLLGKANMHELAAGPTSHNPTFGKVANPVRPDAIAGGSSGGTAAAIAAGLAPAGLGTDTSGSIRTPAIFCGITALRPTTAGHRAWPARGITPLVRALDTAGPMARCADDLAVLHHAMTHTPPLAVPSCIGQRIGVPTGYFFDDLEPAVQHACDAALHALAQAGADLVPIDLTACAQDLAALQIDLGRACRRRDLAAWLACRLPGVPWKTFVRAIASDDVRTLYEDDTPARITASDAQTAIAQHRARLLRVMYDARLDVLAYPATPVTAPTLAAAQTSPDLGMRIAHNARVAAALGWPALVLPVGRDARAPAPAVVPPAAAGLEFLARPGHDGALLAFARAAERAMRGNDTLTTI